MYPVAASVDRSIKWENTDQKTSNTDTFHAVVVRAQKEFL